VRWWPRRIWLGTLLVVAVVSIAGAIYIASRWKLPNVREKIVAILSQQLGSTVELGDLNVSLGRIVRVSGTGLVLHHRVHREGPPLIRIESFTFEVPLLAILDTPTHISSVELHGLRIFIPPRRKNDAKDGDRPESSSPADATEAAAAAASQPEEPAEWLANRLRGPSPVVVDRITCPDAMLEIGLRKPGRPPRTFLIHDLVLTSAAFDRPVTYNAHLTNPIPKGTIFAMGTFGPWNADEPSLTGLTGTYTFADADLDSIKGLAGKLDSNGHFSGVLERITVDGTSTTPDFTLDIGGKPIPLDTVFSAIVDGTNGDTLLNPVRATLGRTRLTASGGIVHRPGQKGRTVSLNVTIDDGYIEDVLRLALDSEPPEMRGGLKLETHLELPPGDQAVSRRLYLKGQFFIKSARFASSKVQDKIDELSRRGRGRPSDLTVDNVASDLTGRFVLDRARLTLSQVSFAVRGATIRLDGTYSLTHSTLDFSGTARLQARVSQMVSGWKRFPLKLVDPLFARKDAGTVLPIRVVGPAKKPEFTVEMKKVIRRSVK
jgi:hypothetical protein